MTNPIEKVNQHDHRLELRQRVVGPWAMNAYAVVCPRTGQSVLVDPGADPEALEDMLAGSTPVAIVITHGHPDHIGALEPMRKRLSVPVTAHGGSEAAPSRVRADQWLEDGDTLAVGDHRLQIYYTPGHTADQVCIGLENDHRVIVGDTIFDGGPGKTWSSEGFRETLTTLRNVILAWPDKTVCYPGHGVSFRLGERRNAIEAFLKKDHGNFHGDAVW